MDALKTILKHGFGGVLRFSGRDDRQTFWLYIGCLYLLFTVVSALLIAPIFLVVFANAAGATSVPGSAAVTGFSTAFAGFGIFEMVATAIMVFLMAAAVARRLRDSGFSPLWGLMPTPFLTFGMIGMSIIFASISQSREPPFFFFPTFVSNLVYNVALIALIILLCLPSKKETTPLAYPSAK